MKKFLLIAIAFLFIAPTFAQRLKRERATYTYTQLPSDPLPIEYKNYLVDVEAANDDKYRRDFLQEKINVKGFSKVHEEADYDFKINLEEYSFRYSDLSKERVERKEKKDGVEKKLISYYYQQKIRYKYNLEVVNKDGEVLISKEYADEINIKGSEASNGKDAYEKFSKKKKKTRKAIPGDVCSSINNMLNDKYAHLPKTKWVKVFYVKKFKRFDYDDIEKARGIFADAVSIIKEDETKTEEFNNAIEPARAIWKKALEESNVQERKTRINEKVTCALLYNLAISHLMMKDFETAKDYFNQALVIRSHYNDSEALIQFADEFTKRIELNKLNTAI